MAVFVSLAAININMLNRGSSVSVGTVSQPGWNQMGKANFGNGQLVGANLEAFFLTTLIDNDIVDSTTNQVQPAFSLLNNL